MTLQNLLGISLEAIEPDRAQVTRLLAAAERNLTDARLAGLSNENRFDAAYKAIMQLAMLALHANGFRPLTSRPGHHQTAIQTLSQTIGLPVGRMIVLDALRKQRNLSDYSGDVVPMSAVDECFDSAAALMADVKAWLAANKPQWTLAQ
ncbi:DNA-binding protein [Burkholderia multivorans]|uniref:DNA-binding protein n=1 Tax=Burkholderia multivorans TaxID=87883 RepID=UPI000D005EB6|nr:DNA-binding protein [Burkholderia multivorans]MBU9165543.1 DNA-binding protein [Burkholderia multivorans]MBU9260105.1 DNA-binding protein [Burkholderia multivorans]MBU9492601.1 DNA-binding protein [Burkholderia multivorans]MBU9542098.1 DNA-binding protein [Burkholderia multivorans]MCA8172827.1 DNA-binding protein [Burkholderia multivorans]